MNLQATSCTIRLSKHYAILEMGECDATNYDLMDKDIAGRGMNVLHLAVHCYDAALTKKMVKQLQKKGILLDALRKENDYGQTPLEFAEETLRNLQQPLASVKKNVKDLEKIKKTLQTASGRKTKKARKSKDI